MVHQCECSIGVLPPKELSNLAATATERSYLEYIVCNGVELVILFLLYARIRLRTVIGHSVSIIHQVCYER